jgi:hypothetical protein
MRTRKDHRRAPACRLLETQVDGQSSVISPAQLSEAISVSNGRELLGYIVHVKGCAVAVSPDGITIGAFRQRKEAFTAISERHGNS